MSGQFEFEGFKNHPFQQIIETRDYKITRANLLAKSILLLSSRSNTCYGLLGLEQACSNCPIMVGTDSMQSMVNIGGKMYLMQATKLTDGATVQHYFVDVTATYIDSVTGLYNRPYFDSECNRIGRDKRFYPVTVIYADVNGLKSVNDTLGHTVGDNLLQLCAEQVKQITRNSDIVARTGGDEIQAFLPNTNRAEAKKIYRRLERALKETNFSSRFTPNAGLSFGMFTVSRPDKLQSAFTIAEKRMYHSKRANGNHRKLP